MTTAPLADQRFMGNDDDIIIIEPTDTTVIRAAENEPGAAARFVSGAELFGWPEPEPLRTMSADDRPDVLAAYLAERLPALRTWAAATGADLTDADLVHIITEAYESGAIESAPEPITRTAPMIVIVPSDTRPAEIVDTAVEALRESLETETAAIRSESHESAVQTRSTLDAMRTEFADVFARLLSLFGRMV